MPSSSLPRLGVAFACEAVALLSPLGQANAMDQPVAAVEVALRNGPGPNRVRLQAGAWSTERALGPNEPWHVRVPVAAPGRAITLRFDVQHGFIPADIDARSGDHRSLGCWVEVH